MNGREQIIRTVRRSLGRDSGPAAPQVAALEHRQASRPRHARPSVGPDLVAQLKQQMARVQMTVTELNNSDQLGSAVAEFLQEHQLPLAVTISPELSDTAWPETLEVHTGAARAEDLSSVTACLCAIAETGSIVMAASPQSPATLRFMPDNHMVVLRRAQVLSHLEEAWAVLRAQPGSMSRAVHINTGPSRTGDVEQVIEIGAHGPRRMHVFLID